eukprot:CAMPEP_0117589578 /NCGR_PEP_ID=MMETSP0784-20121206/70489_1 /TAXON_ID=39447 /ORGANISM="" /LENGTH=97 /DNA_ID=CAMNT_0005391073 /DNA_START=53 /DNA_END=343 /DNA_ORIENTATION=+
MWPRSELAAIHNVCARLRPERADAALAFNDLPTFGGLRSGAASQLDQLLTQGTVLRAQSTERFLHGRGHPAIMGLDELQRKVSDTGMSCSLGGCGGG